MRPLLDGASVGLSVACLVHCLALPVAAAALPAFAGLFETPEWTHAALLALALPLSFSALVAGYRRHGRRLPIVVGGVGLALMAAGVAFEEMRLAEVGLTVSGATLVALAHLRNWNHLGAARPRTATAGA